MNLISQFTSTAFVVSLRLCITAYVTAYIAEEDSYSFVALIDIVLTDGAKRTCTGTIIHDNVVITIAHCFIQEKDRQTQAELTASFVVIGTKKMFDTGYEQYLPIERVIIHPDFKGWSHDLALVFTFASMVSDKPGRIIPLANDGLMTPVDGNVTVISWGRCKDVNILKPKTTREYWSNEELLYTTEQTRLRKRFKVTSRGKHRYDSNKGTKSETVGFYEPRAQKSTIMDVGDDLRSEYSQWQRTHIENSEENIDLLYEQLNNQSDFDSAEDKKKWDKTKVALDKFQSKMDIRKMRSSYLQTTYNVLPHYKNNWRRKMGKQQNKLTVEVFGFINVASCKKIVEKTKPALYQIQNGNEVICYASENRFVTVEDSGAPAISHGHLVAVTVGGAESEGDEVAIGMKISCYCSWIAEHLPDGGPLMQCCNNCCDPAVVRYSENNREERRLRRKKKRRL
ncbi:uncharacterized protein LOC123695093 isoform X2 [Colias croceus]|uniref:uncharacterized protein LOC123695093 isoform X2 n=1 Tax=Colias crocea TaxID=72248 RepID=UPI001E27F8CB|nr:uncharacterized protein LOC123695093 isoform X2 [Colias croceus]